MKPSFVTAYYEEIRLKEFSDLKFYLNGVGTGESLKWVKRWVYYNMPGIYLDGSLFDSNYEEIWK